jgi:hypothetical protein|tara:strand:- start:128 stop:310 length:183 start_codon:yes stop_codon:yes gene_type:complete
MNDPIVEEVRRAREELMKEHGSLEALAKAMQQREARDGQKVVSYAEVSSASEPMIFKEDN